MHGTKKIGVVIGGSGLLGGTTVNYFKTRYPESVDIRAPSSKKLSIRQESDIRRYIFDLRPDFIINCSMANLAASGQLAYEVNYQGAINLARAATSLGIPYIHISSAAVLPAGENLREEDTLQLTSDLSNYAKSKLMAEISLREMARTRNLDYTVIRLAIVYGAHDHKIQGFHRMFFSIADEAMPFLFTRKDTHHSYSNARKLPYFIHHCLENREEFSGETYNFVDPNPVDLSTLILTIKSYLQVPVPKEIFVPFWLAKSSSRAIETVLRVLRKIGLKAEMPPELMFLDSFYKPQTLACDKLKNSSFEDPFPDETIFTRLPELVIYYLTRWTNENRISSFRETLAHELQQEEIFLNDPQALIDAIHERGLEPFPDVVKQDIVL